MSWRRVFSSREAFIESRAGAVPPNWRPEDGDPAQLDWPPPPGTIRGRLEAQEAILEEMAEAIRCDLWKPPIGVVYKVSALREHAVAALELLDNAECSHPTHFSGRRHRLVLDPAPRGDAE